MSSRTAIDDGQHQSSKPTPADVPLPSTPASPSPSTPSSRQTNSSEKRRKKGRSTRTEKTVLLFVVVFLANSINGQRIMKSVNSQFDQYYDYYASTGTNGDMPQQQSAPVQNRIEDTALVMTTSSIPSNPSTLFVNTVLNTTIQHLIGLSPTAPILIMIDGFRFSDLATNPALEDRVKRLDEYTINLFSEHLANPRIHVIPAMSRNHIGRSVVKAINLIEKNWPSVKYLYYLQHDFPFVRDIDHTGMVKAMEEHEKINWIRFPKRPPHTVCCPCGDEKPINFNSTMIPSDGSTNGTAITAKKVLSPITAYSDNNHLTRLKWYKETIVSLVKIDRAPEDPLQKRANSGCFKLPRRDNIYGLYMLHEQAIAHLDGRHTAST